MVKLTSTITIDHRDKAEISIAKMAESTALRNKLEAEMNLKIQKLKDEYKEKIAKHDLIINDHSIAIEEWAEKHPELFDKVRSIEFTRGKVGYRLSTPAVKPVKGKNISLDKVLPLLKGWARKYLRPKPELNKELIIEHYTAGKVKPKQLEKLGLKVVQEDNFFIDITLDEVPNQAATA